MTFTIECWELVVVLAGVRVLWSKLPPRLRIKKGDAEISFDLPIAPPQQRLESGDDADEGEGEPP